MTYQVLARKWRPGNFAEMVGQGHVLKTLINALDSERLHHAYLFTGTRGVGKTTIARILAKCLNCEQGISSTPCGKCGACTEISEGRFIDLIEIDAASRTRVEDTRELLETVPYSPARGRFKVYLIDEVHMLSTHSFNALLKTLEEPPSHVKFLFATTDPHKLPITVLSRCLQFNLKNLSPQLITRYLQSVLEKEQIDNEEAALWHIGRAAKGSMRDALTLLDQAISYCDGNVNEEGVKTLLGTPDQEVIFEILEALGARQADRLLACIASIAENNPDYFQLQESIMAVLHRVAIAQVLKDAIDNSEGDKEQILTAAGQFSAEEIQLYYQIALKGREDLVLASDHRMVFEMLLLRMLAFTPEGVPHSPTVPLLDQDKDRAGNVVENRDNDQESNNEKKKLKIPPSLPPVEVVITAPREEAVRQEKEELSQNKFTCQADSEASTMAAPVESEEHQNTELNLPEDHTLIELSGFQSENWLTVFEQLPVSGITRSVLANCVVEKVNGTSIDLILDETQSSLYSEEHKSRMEQAFAEYFTREIKLQVRLDKLVVESPAGFSQRKRQEYIQQAIDDFKQDPNVKDVLKHFSAQIQQDSIAPIIKQEKA